MERNLYIDFAKGIATLSIIFIHTAFWSGQFYVPSEIRVFSLLFDVALFFALSGITSSGNIEKTLFRLLKLQITYMMFVTLLFFLDYFFKAFGLAFFSLDALKDFYSIFGSKYVATSISAYPQWQYLGNWYLHEYTNADTFPVVMGSFWYLKVYYILTILAVLILRFFPKHVLWFIGICVGLTLLFNLVPSYYPTGRVGYVAFYLAVFLIAHQLKGKKIANTTIPWLYLGVGCGLIFLYFQYGSSVFLLMNKQKFPPKIPYIIWSFLSLTTLFVLYNRLKITKESKITYIGKNAIFFYFAQGISSSLVYFLVILLKDTLEWWFLMPIVYVCNVFLAFLLAKLLIKVDQLGWEALRNLYEKTAIKV